LGRAAAASAAAFGGLESFERRSKVWIGRVLERLPRAKEELFRRRPSTHWTTNQPREPLFSL
jgi:hypothetical protein